ncbi:Lipase maturation factor 2 [Symbiodinium microadriaticum]|uniref:Lipase maturation factor 2 n=1 Tax=Symbiodinium microadriaticum TaxID=2951 RepID=A0A1Q9E1C9_SYMMI|nr:Lipase maturation factor 2 [Symbiodinium microadriaticum]
MVWAALLLVPFVLAATIETWLGLVLAVVFFLGSAAQLAGGLGVLLPAEELLQIFDFGAARYGLFARMSGVGGRPTEVLEGALTPSGPWSTVPFRYQVVETTRLPWLQMGPVSRRFAFLTSHVWTGPIGLSPWAAAVPGSADALAPWSFEALQLEVRGDGDLQGWLGQFLSQVQMGSSEVLNLLDRPEFEQRFPDGPPQFLRISPRTFLATLPGEDGAWWVSQAADMDAAAWVDMPEGSILEKPALLAALPPALAEPTPWLTL